MLYENTLYEGGEEEEEAAVWNHLFIFQGFVKL